MQRESAPIKELLMRVNPLPQISAATVYKLRQVLTSDVRWQYNVSFSDAYMTVNNGSLCKASLFRVPVSFEPLLVRFRRCRTSRNGCHLFPFHL